MTEPLVKIIEREKGRNKVIEINGERYYSLRYAAELAQVSRVTMHRWVRQGCVISEIPEVNDIQIKAVRDIISGHLYLSEETVEKLKFENRVMYL